MLTTKNLLAALVCFVPFAMISQAQAQNDSYDVAKDGHRFSEEFLANNVRVSAFVMEGGRLFQQGNVDGAFKQYQQALALSDDCGPAYIGTLYCYMAKGDDRKAFSLYEAMFRPDARVSINQFGATTPHRMRYVLLLLKRGRMEEARAIFNESAGYLEQYRKAEYPNDPPLGIEFNDPYFSRDLFEAAARTAIAMEEHYQGNDKTALFELEQARKKRARFAVASFYQGEIWRNAPETFDQAREAHLRAIQYGNKAVRAAVVKMLEVASPAYKENAGPALRAAIDAAEAGSAVKTSPPK